AVARARAARFAGLACCRTLCYPPWVLSIRCPILTSVSSAGYAMGWSLAIAGSPHTKKPRHIASAKKNLNLSLTVQNPTPPPPPTPEPLEALPPLPPNHHRTTAPTHHTPPQHTTPRSTTSTTSTRSNCSYLKVLTNGL